MICEWCSFFDPECKMCECTCHHVEPYWECEYIPMWNNPIDRIYDTSIYSNIDDKYICSCCGRVEIDISNIDTYRFCPSCGCRISKEYNMIDKQNEIFAPF